MSTPSAWPFESVVKTFEVSYSVFFATAHGVAYAGIMKYSKVKCSHHDSSG